MTEYKNIKGGAELHRVLTQLPTRIERKILRGALRAGARVILDYAKVKVPVKSGKLRDSLRVSTNVKRGTVTAKVVAGGNKKGQAFYAHMVEGGTRPHRIAAKKGRGLFLGGRFAKSVDHPGSRARPFMKPALDSGSDAALNEVGNYVKTRLHEVL